MLADLIRVAVLGTVVALTGPGISADPPDAFPPGWTAISPREEIRPAFSFEPNGGPKKAGCFVIVHDQREGLDGWMQKSFPVTGGEFFRFQAVRKLTGVDMPRRSALVRVLWQNDDGKMVSADVPEQQVKELGHVPTAEPEHPVDGSTDANGWTTVSGVYRVPRKATRAVVELHLQWAPNGRVEWSDVEFAKTSPPPNRKVRLATVHYKPMGKTPRENCEEFAPLIAEAANQNADLVVLGETVPTASPNVKPQKVHETAEPIPGPSTDYFGELAKKHNLHIVLSLYERDKHLVYNTAVLLGPDGKLIGKYRKVCLPHGEVEKGIAPGHEYPVFDTKFGKVGLMVCYDGFFPEVARELSNRGAEVIAWPVWGCNPQLAKARACENHVYLVSSTFMAPKDGWMLSAVFDQTGKPIAQADTWGTVAVAEVELSQPYIGPYNLGDFRSMIERHRPVKTPDVNETRVIVALAASVRGDEPKDNRSDFEKTQETKVLALLAHGRETYKTADAWAERTRIIREDFLIARGLWPIPARPPVKVIAHSRREHDGYSVENVALETVPGFYCVGNLYRPLGLSKPGPAILCPHGHFVPMEPGTPGGRFREEQQQRCAHFARMGATVYSYSMVGWQDSQQTVHLDPLVLALQTWNSLRAVDYVLSLPNVDPQRLGVTGASGGGTQAMLLALIEPRISVCAPVVIVGLNSSGCLCEGGVWTYTNFPEVAAMLAPRPQLLISCGDDWTRDFPAKGFPFVEHFYELAGGKGKVKNVHLAKEGHDFGPSKRKAVYEFFAEHLKLALMEEDNSKIKFETPDQMEVFNARHPLPAHAVKGSNAVAAAFATMLKSRK